MPNLAFSPGPQQPHAGEKENAVAADAGASKGAVDPSARRRSSGGDGPALGRSPLERLCSDGESSEASRVATTVPPEGGGVVACKRNSSCKCPDCDMAASVFGIDQLRQVGGGGVARSPVNGGGSAVARSPPPSSAVPEGDGDRGPVPGTPIAGDVGGNAAAREEEAVCTPDRLVGAAEMTTSGAKQGEVATFVARSPDVNEEAVEQEAGGVVAADAGSGTKKKGWGFRMARAVFSPAASVLPPKSQKRKEAGEEEEESGKERTESVDAPAQATSETVAASHVESIRDTSAAGLVPSPERNGPESTDDLLSGDDGEDDVAVDEEEGEVDGDDQAAAVAGGTCEAPKLVVAEGGEEGGGGGVAVVAEAISGEPAVAEAGKEPRSSKRPSKHASRGKRLSKDVFFECSSEVEHVLASESESGSESDQSEHEPTPVERSIAFSPADKSKVATVASPPRTSPLGAAAGAPAAASTLDALPQRPVRTNSPDPAAKSVTEAAVAAAAAQDSVAAAAASAAVVPRSEVGGGSAGPPGGAAAVGVGGDAGVAVEEAKQAGAAAGGGSGGGASGGAVRGVVGGGRRRNRRAAPALGLGAEAYTHEDNRSKFSQAEVNAKIRERLAEEQVAFDKSTSALKAAHEEELKAAAERLQRSSSDGNRAKMAARDTEALEREIAMLSERFGEAAAEARASGKALREKEALLDAVTAQLMGLKVELQAGRESHSGEKLVMQEEVDTERRLHGAAEGRLAQLDAAYNRLEDTEREKRAAGILKMKKDMQALAYVQFGEANKKHNVVKARLDAAEAEVRQLREAAQGQDAQITTEREQAEEFRRQVETLQNEQANSAADASRKEQLLQEDVAALRADAESRMDELEAMSRERDAANNGRDVSQDALARMAIRNTELKESVADLEGKVKELEGFCTQALDELDREKALRAAAGN